MSICVDENESRAIYFQIKLLVNSTVDENEYEKFSNSNECIQVLTIVRTSRAIFLICKETVLTIIIMPMP